MQQLVGPEVQIVDNGEAVARQTRRLLANQLTFMSPGDTPDHESCFTPISADSTLALATGQVKLFTTGQPHALRAAATRWLGLDAVVSSL